MQVYHHPYQIEKEASLILIFVFFFMCISFPAFASINVEGADNASNFTTSDSVGGSVVITAS